MGTKACKFLGLSPGARDRGGFRECVLTFETMPSTSLPHEVLLEEGLMPGGVTLDGQRRPFGFVIIIHIANSLYRRTNANSLSNQVAK